MSVWTTNAPPSGDGFERLAQRLAMTAFGNHVKPTRLCGDRWRKLYLDDPVGYDGPATMRLSLPRWETDCRQPTWACRAALPSG